MTIERHIEELRAELRNAVDRGRSWRNWPDRGLDVLRENMVLACLGARFRHGCDPTPGSTGAGIAGRPQYPFSVR
ncbi:hypothetical protein [Phyllobacterium chamaecytisi]|uniref:hypothetical protein n=1 Tax=Phyllobacterium chamaecytisi TaxID=2876082 RepID=UPI001CCEECF9|nr:hypothetical protein [Phyllobacterium sp. KW56]MBZ9603536.1 hypothetical protein [Phyllobacterium sp. KW56]